MGGKWKFLEDTLLCAILDWGIMRTMKATFAAVLLVLSDVAAHAEGTKEDWDRLAHPTVRNFVICARGEVDRHWDDEAQVYEVARNAITACEDRLEPLNEILAAEPFREPVGGINATISQIKGEARAAIIEDVEERRKVK